MSIETITPPRTRWAAILWGALFAAVAAGSLWLLSDDNRGTGLTDWALTLTPAMITTLAILVAGVLVIVGGTAGLARRAQRRGSASAQSSDADTEPLPSA